MESVEDIAEKAAVSAARAAGDLLRKYWQGSNSFVIEFKAATDLVTEADKKAEKLIMDTLTSHFPSWDFLCEESGATVRGSGNAPYRWIVDPLDGTTSFTHKHPHFSVSIALEKRGHGVVLGVVYGVALDEMFVARLGRGAYCNGRPIKVSSTAQLINALIVTGFPSNRAQLDRLEANFPFFEAMLLQSRDCRRNGSAALDLCYVACGRHDLYWEPQLKAWDVGAGGLIVQEAGGKFTDVHGRPVSYQEAQSEADKFPVLGSNGLLHQATLDTFDRVRKEHEKK